jgi:hypothetical protein
MNGDRFAFAVVLVLNKMFAQIILVDMIVAEGNQDA